MNVILKRRQLILAILVVALGAAVFVNWYYTSDSSLSTNDTTSPQYVQNLGEAKYVNATGDNVQSFEELKYERKKKNDEAIDKLNKSLEAAGKGTDEAAKIAESIDKITKIAELELDLENLVKTKINSECFVTVTDKNARVVVHKGVLNETTSLQILELVTSNTQIPPDAVVISEQK